MEKEVKRDPRVVWCVFCVFPAGSCMASPPKAITCPQAARNESLLGDLVSQAATGLWNSLSYCFSSSISFPDHVTYIGLSEHRFDNIPSTT